jgi:hypothetical protein
MPTPLTHDDPTTLGPYRLVARLGSGGMGTVYMARTAGGRTVALKTMHAGIATDPAARTRFRLEVDAARVIGDRFGARVMDADPLGETPWLATEFVLGPALDEAVRSGGPLPERSVRALGAALCSALDQLHRSDVVHRDLKPSNILVTAYGPKVIDFGIARAIGDDRLTRTGASVGTPAFMSPEQATGKEHDAAGDVFALAGVLVYAATARPPFGHGQPADLLYRVRYADADLRGVPAPLVPVLARCLAKEPAKRPGLAELTAQLHDGAGEFAEHLPDTLLAQIGRRAADVWRIVPERLAAPPVEAGASAVTALPGPGPSRRGLLTAVGALAVTAAAGGGMWWQRGRATATVSEVTQQTRNLDPLWQHERRRPRRAGLGSGRAPPGRRIDLASVEHDRQTPRSAHRAGAAGGAHLGQLVAGGGAGRAVVPARPRLRREGGVDVDRRLEREPRAARDRPRPPSRTPRSPSRRTSSCASPTVSRTWRRATERSRGTTAFCPHRPGPCAPPTSGPERRAGRSRCRGGRATADGSTSPPRRPSATTS